MNCRCYRWWIIALLGLMNAAERVEAEDLKAAAHAAMRNAVAFYTKSVAIEGGYVYQVSDDLSKREGEGVTDNSTVWVQPPGTPFVGMAYLDAYELTHQEYLLEAAVATANCLIRGQLQSGGWSESISFAPARRQQFAYRVDQRRSTEKQPFNVSTFDDDKSQSAMRFLMKLDQITRFQDVRLHESISYALDATIKAQYPNGGWPQGFAHPATEVHPKDLKASYPADWPRQPTEKYYYQYYTLNDNAMMDVIDVMLRAYEVYSDRRYLAAAQRGGDFLILAQMPSPQPAWAQQYNFSMNPCWARKFEPPAISGEESQGAIRALLKLFIATGDRRYLKPIPPAIDYLKSSLLSDQSLARFYEMQTNKPLYFTKDYQLTYDDKDLPTHYSFKVKSRLDQLSKDYEQISRLTPKELVSWQKPSLKKPGKPSPSLERETANAISSLDARGAWVEDGRLRYHGKGDTTRRVITSETFARNLKTLSRYIAATEANEAK